MCTKSGDEVYGYDYHRDCGSLFRCTCVSCACQGAKDCTPEINTSEIVVDFQWYFPMDVQWHFPTKLIFQWYFPKDCHVSSGFVLNLSNGFSVAFSNGVLFV